MESVSGNIAFADVNSSTVFLSLVGLLIAVYSYYVKWSFKRNPVNYRALCDLNETISCTRVVTSKYGSGFGFMGTLFGENSVLNMSNSILGAVFYSLQIILTCYNQHELIQLTALTASVASIIGSVYLAYILYFVLKDICIVCIASYVVNALLLYNNWQIYYSK